MPDSLRILAADPQPEMQQFYAEILPQMGHKVLGIVASGRSLIGRCRSDQPDLVISDVNLLDMDAVAAAEQIAREAAIPMIILTARPPSAMTDQTVVEHRLTFLIKPVSRARLAAEIPLAVRRFQATPGVIGGGEIAGENRSGRV